MTTDLKFPTLLMEKVRLPRLILGTNPFNSVGRYPESPEQYAKLFEKPSTLPDIIRRGTGHFSKARSLAHAKTFTSPRIVADLIVKSVGMGANAIFLCLIGADHGTIKAVAMAQKEVDGKLIVVPYIQNLRVYLERDKLKEGIRSDIDLAKRIGGNAEGGQILTVNGEQMDSLLHWNRENPRIDHAEEIFGIIREGGLIPVMTSHNPKSLLTSELNGYDVAGYIIIINKVGYQMDYGESGATLKAVRYSTKPVIGFKPLAFGRIPPIEALEFTYNVPGVRGVAVGIGSEEEMDETYRVAREVIEANPSLRVSD